MTTSTSLIKGTDFICVGTSDIDRAVSFYGESLGIPELKRWGQMPGVQKWHDHIGEPTLADAICDRLLHNAHRIVLKGPSRRKETKLDS